MLNYSVAELRYNSYSNLFFIVCFRKRLLKKLSALRNARLDDSSRNQYDFDDD